MALRIRRRAPTSSGSRPRRPLPAGVVAVLLLLLGAGYLLDRVGLLPDDVARVLRNVEQIVLDTLSEGRSPGPSVPPVGRAEDVDLQAARTLLARIRVEPERRRGYDRSDWPHWLDQDGNCLNAREEVLKRQSLRKVRLSADGCAIVSGLWRDPYTGEEFSDPDQLDVDHLVPLEEAHNSGGHAWDRERRAAFANDLDDPRTLIAVSREANRAKGSKGPEQWLPPQTSYRCHYVADWIAVKARWELSMDESERAAVGNILNACAAEVTASARRPVAR